MTGKPTRIMVIEGSSVSRAILTRTLRDELNNCEVSPVSSGRDALALLENEKFDLITTALLLPDMDGLKLSSKIRKSSTHHYTPVIVVSGDADDRLLREGFEAGVTDYFDKSEGYRAFGTFISSFIQRNSGLVGKILYVEDSKTAASVTTTILEKHGLRVEHCITAEEALETLTEQHNNDTNFENKDIEKYDLVITDFYLKDSMTGGDLLHAIRVKLHYSQQELPVLVLTGNEESDNQVVVFHAGANDFVLKPIVEEVLMARVRALLMIKHQFDALKHQAEYMRWIAATDSLTGARSKRYLLDNGESFITNPNHNPVWAMIIDIDRFKQINDTLGHITGDHVLAALGDLLLDVFKDAMVVRFGGEEFCVLIANIEAVDILELAEEFRNQVETLNPSGVNITISIGLANYADNDNASLSRFISYADKALYFSKQQGRNRVSLYENGTAMASPLHGLPMNFSSEKEG
ncbi:Two-component transcriptional response regulator, LuxR family [hydrothermal vent metagenome]|uniref:Two-component transcriptional response regulator, LuxR family n=1 Tax=hydrothermal vent metagenome TaxID=652676 RepID=A0A3B1B952_9ZZZZ